MSASNQRTDPTDDRLVPVTDGQANVRELAKTFLPLGARVIPLTTEKADDYKTDPSGNSGDRIACGVVTK